MPDAKLLYHVTKKEYLDSILKDGLKPMIGDNSSAVSEEEPMIYLCEKKDIPIWTILTKGDSVLEVNVKGLRQKFEEFNYVHYGEYMASRPIKPERISIAKTATKQQMQRAMHTLAELELYTLSQLCFNALRYEWSMLHVEDDPEVQSELMERVRDSAANISSYLATRDRIDLSVLTQKEMAGIVREHSNEACYVTFADSYFYKGLDSDVPDAGKRCWEHLANMQIQELKEPCLELHKYIKANIPYYVRKLPGIGGFCM